MRSVDSVLFLENNSDVHVNRVVSRLVLLCSVLWSTNMTQGSHFPGSVEKSIRIFLFSF